MIRRLNPTRSLSLILISVFVLASLAASQPASAGSAGPKLFELPSANVNPNSITTGPDGALWFNDSGGIGRITTTGATSQFSHAAGNSIITGPDGALWFTEAGAIGRITKAGVFSDFILPANVGANGGYGRRITDRPVSITVGPDGALWYTVRIFSSSCVCNVGGKIGCITTSGAISEFTLPTGGTRRTAPAAGGIVAGPDGALWFTDSQLRRIDRITTTGTLTNFAVSQGQPVGITKGPNGNLWFTANAGTSAMIGKITMSGAITEFTVATDPDNVSIGPDVVFGADGNLWTGVYPSVTGIGTVLKVTTSGAVTRFPLQTYDSVNGIAKGPDNAVWFSVSHMMHGTSAIGRISTG